jgi:hypothetical protein
MRGGSVRYRDNSSSGRRERAVDECSEIDLPLMTAALIKVRAARNENGAGSFLLREAAPLSD